jgi:serine/threonine protein phosphatase PrpC
MNTRQFDASFCSIVVMPPIPPDIEWIAVYFVKTIILSDTMKSLSLETDQDLATALAPAGVFHGGKVILTSGSSIGLTTIVNERLDDGIGCSATGGRSRKYEDNIMSVKAEGVVFSAVFDGHVGSESAIISGEVFAKILGPEVGKVFDGPASNVKKAMKRSFSLVNDELRRRSVRDGTTAVIIAVKGKRLACGHLGDSLALLVCKESDEWLTRSHRPTDRNEYNRMRMQNKAVSEDWRVDGRLCVSRSLGDFWCCNGMYDDPDVVVRELGEDAMSVVLGCDGLWDFIDRGIVCSLVRGIRDPVRAAKVLQDYAFASGSHDSISVIVMNFAT